MFAMICFYLQAIHEFRICFWNGIGGGDISAFVQWFKFKIRRGGFIDRPRNMRDARIKFSYSFNFTNTKV